MARVSAYKFALIAAACLALACSSDVVTGGPAATATNGPAGTGGGTSSSSASVGGAGASAAGGSSMGGSGGTSGAMILEPTTLEFFDLPIGSIRYAVAGQDQASNTCVTFVWQYGTQGAEFMQNCASMGMQAWPYVIVTPGATAPCMQWDYMGNVTVDMATGCVQFISTNPLSADVDVSVNVSAGPFVGTIVVDNVP